MSEIKVLTHLRSLVKEIAWDSGAAWSHCGTLLTGALRLLAFRECLKRHHTEASAPDERFASLRLLIIKVLCEESLARSGVRFLEARVCEHDSKKRGNKKKRFG